MLKLAAVFENAAGKNHSWSFNDPDPNKSPEAIKEALEAMTTIHLFEKDGIRQFCKVVSAKFVETIETPLFDLSKPTPEAYVADPNNIFAAHIVSEEETQVSEMPVVNEAKIVVEEISAEEATAPKAVPASETIKSIEQKAMMAANSLKAPLLNSDSLAAVGKKATTNNVSVALPSASSQKLETVLNETESELPRVDDQAVQKPINPRKAQVDRIRAYHEANKKKKKGKKKKR
ncbi:DUF2922 domain-containing protein [Enterococcus pallens]|uniref:DUF2922 family protein n=1 Tax=Enterococcus pallens ATCC BAA-351 TaxID=1158607 RepID=R2QCQ7_9ENTE|nr:DUF2922 domain-containing protein [Enterococcus pallens]EOH93018.1 hypothetical protein UAU_02660 [Enterococcus pallens ATCC BAA-351]EOU24804.1 hypothetical protein I588_00791 [Enterococcus pallens ATCC BAA-351]